MLPSEVEEVKMGRDMMSPLEIMLIATAEHVKEGDTEKAADVARKVAPYVAMSAEQIIGALKAGIPMEEFLRHRAALLRKVGIES